MVLTPNQKRMVRLLVDQSTALYELRLGLNERWKASEKTVFDLRRHIAELESKINPGMYESDRAWIAQQIDEAREKLQLSEHEKADRSKAGDLFDAQHTPFRRLTDRMLRHLGLNDDLTDRVRMNRVGGL